MTQAPATPELVERLRDERANEGERASDIMVRWNAQRKEAADALEAQQARIAELEDENEQLRLAICGGEDAPGYASSLPLETILKVCSDNHATARRDGQMAWNGNTATSWRSCAEEAQALADRYEKALRFYANAVVASQHPDRLGACDDGWAACQALSSSQGRHEGGGVGLPELPGVNAVPLPASPDGTRFGVWFTPVSGLWKDQSLSRLERVRAHRWQFKSELKEAVDAVDEEASRQALIAKSSPDNTNPEAGSLDHD